MSTGERTIIGGSLFSPKGGDHTQSFECATVGQGDYEEAGFQETAANLETVRGYYTSSNEPLEDSVTTLESDLSPLESTASDLNDRVDVLSTTMHFTENEYISGTSWRLMGTLNGVQFHLRRGGDLEIRIGANLRTNGLYVDWIGEGTTMRSDGYYHRYRSIASFSEDTSGFSEGYSMNGRDTQDDMCWLGCDPRYGQLGIIGSNGGAVSGNIIASEIASPYRQWEITWANNPRSSYRTEYVFFRILELQT